jgi:hypothetical protein
MKTIRANTFETNSSSTHSMVILTEKQDNQLRNGELYLSNKYDEGIITKEEADKIFFEVIKEYNLQYPNDNIETIEDFKETNWYLDNQDEYPCDIDRWCESDYLASDSSNYTSPSGDKLIIYTKYGYNG